MELLVLSDELLDKFGISLKQFTTLAMVTLGVL